MLSPEPPLLFGFVYFGGEPPLPTYAVASVHMFDFLFIIYFFHTSVHCCRNAVLKETKMEQPTLPDGGEFPLYYQMEASLLQHSLSRSCGLCLLTKKAALN